MFVRRALLAAFIAVGLAASALVATPAQAAYTPSIDTLDTSAPGRVTGTVSTDAPYVRLSLLANGTDARIVPVPPDNRTVSYDFETWGLSTGTVSAAGCDGPEASSCFGPVRRSFTVTANDVRPVVGWSEEEVLGPDETLAVEISDPEGGGRLAVAYGCLGDREFVTREGTSQVALRSCRDGEHTVTLIRCHSTVTLCVSTGLSHVVRVDRRVESSIRGFNKFEVGPGGDDDPDITVTLGVSGWDATRDYRLDWQLTRVGEDAPARTGAVEGLSPDSNWDLRTSLDIDGLPTAEYVLGGTVSFVDEDGATVPGKLPAHSGFRVDATPPEVTTTELSWRTLYPDDTDNYRNYVSFHVETNEPARQEMEVYDAEGNLITTSHDGVTWRGRDDRQRLVAEGSYELVVTVTDGGRNKAVTSTKVRVSHKRLVDRVLRRQVSAKGSLIDTWTGRCSSVRRPAPGRGAGSVGLHSNTSCGGRAWDRSGVVSVHGLELPRALRYGTFVVTTLGGAPNSVPGSRAFIEYWNAQTGRWRHHHVLPTPFRDHVGDSGDGGRVVAGRELTWRTYTAQGARYDLASFAVRMRYEVLVRP